MHRQIESGKSRARNEEHADIPNMERDEESVSLLNIKRFQAIWRKRNNALP